MLGPLFNVPCPTAFMALLILSFHISTISSLVPNFGCKTFMIFIPCFCYVTTVTFTSIPLSVSFAFLSVDFWASLCPKIVSLLTYSKLNPSLNFLLLVPFTSYKDSKAKLTFFVNFFLTMTPWLMFSLDSFDLPFHLFGMTKLNSLLMPLNVLSLLLP